RSSPVRAEPRERYVNGVRPSETHSKSISRNYATNRVDAADILGSSASGPEDLHHLVEAAAAHETHGAHAGTPRRGDVLLPVVDEQAGPAADAIEHVGVDAFIWFGRTDEPRQHDRVEVGHERIHTVQKPDPLRRVVGQRMQ